MIKHYLIGSRFPTEYNEKNNNYLITISYADKNAPQKTDTASVKAKLQYILIK